MKKTDQKGFTVVEALIVVLVLVLLGGAGWATLSNPAYITSPQLVNIFAMDMNRTLCGMHLLGCCSTALNRGFIFGVALDRQQ